MRLVIIGSGSLASLFAAALSSQVELVMLGHWPAQIARLQEYGLKVIHIDGQESHHFFPVTNDPSFSFPADIALVLVKSYQTLRAAYEVNDLLSPDGIAITLQNGLGNWEILAKVLGPDRVVQGTASLGANMVKPGVVRYAGAGKVYIAESDGHETILEQVVMWMNASALDAELTKNIEGLVWGKLAINAGINPLTALLRVANGYLATNKLAQNLAAAAADEAALVAGKLGINLPFSDVRNRVIEVIELTAQNRSSMLQDVERNGPTEIDAICGQIVKHGLLVGVKTPINAEFLRLLNMTSESITSVVEPLQILLADRNSPNLPLIQN